MTAARTRCPACGAERSRPTFAVRGHRFRRCRGCRTLFLESPPDPAAAGALYEDERYFANPDYEAGSYHGYKDYLADREEIEQKFELVLGHVERYASPGRLLDVGAGPGLLVNTARSRGWDARGIDVNPWAARYAQEQVGVQVEAETLEAARFEDGQFDAVTMMDLIEHFSEPAGQIAEAARITRPGGVLALLTPDAGSPVTRAIGRRWPEVQRAPEHIVLFSVSGLGDLLERHGWEPLGWHWIGKTSSLETLVADLTPAAPTLGSAVRRAIGDRPIGRRHFDLDPRAKFVFYARRRGVATHQDGDRGEVRRPLRISKRPVQAEAAILEDLRTLADARRLCDWMFDQYRDAVRGSVAEVGAGIGTFSERILAAGAKQLLLLEPEPSCAQVLERRFGGDGRVRIVREELPDVPLLREGRHDLIVCQNVLEHIDRDGEALEEIAGALAPGGRLSLIVPAHPRLFGPLDDTYGHHRRYTRERAREIAAAAGLVIDDLYSFNLLGVPGWWAKNRRPGSRVSARSLAAYQSMLRLWRPLEEVMRPPWGLSLVVQAHRPAAGTV